MTYKFSSLDEAKFLAEYWQKKPAIIKNAFKDFIDPLSPDELAGLAAEAEIESRIINRDSDDNWHVEHGPFDDYSAYGDKNWTLLVQAVDHWCETGADLVRPFRFIPNWRIDDLMVSFSTPNGGVGPHLDQYDVFIIQGMGKRHWRVGLPQSLNNEIPHPDLLQVSQFEALIDEVLEPGDLLYIPPNCPHEGYAIENSLNYSVGFRAPNQQDLLSSFADFALQEESFKKRFSDPERSLTEHISEVSDADIQSLKSLMLEQFEQDGVFNQWLGCYLTQAKHDLAIELPESELTAEELESLFEEYESLVRLGGLRVAIIKTQLYLNGEAVSLTSDQIELARYLADNDLYESSKLDSLCDSDNSKRLLLLWINSGYIYPKDC
ncbi:cupin domain-containing protein [Catenovulum maritimum]|uniref:50S ribosomal protein L16 arginine hydroxylase n=1 Tax=Catenovulum maritimum TaxID=1513271 RepID=A0A0J8JPH2_9ALTE|nr:cupin domain-containing protein [Catenovulum maritimum]KMT66541.1 50S ribosomal protein L16 arginine hydroxylase [Catenovulum maritimum]